MTFEQVYLLCLLVAALGLFAWGKWRYDLVALAALLAATIAGTVPFDEAFSGFSHPATVTVVFVLIVSRGLTNAGAVDLIARHLLPPIKSPSAHVGVLSGTSGALSTIMNDVGALALLMPAALQSAEKVKRPPSLVLMPLAFGSLLGGLVTLIGTPPNIIIAAYRGQETGTPFGMFDFTPVGGTVAVAGIIFIALVGWRLVPEQRRARLSARDLFEIKNYVAEALVPEGSKSVGKSMRDLDDAAGEHDAVLLHLVRRNERIDHIGRRETVLAGDRLIVEAGPDALKAVMQALELTPPTKTDDKHPLLGGIDLSLAEAVVRPRSRIAGRSVAELRLRSRFGANLLAVSRQGAPFRGRLMSFRFRPGDVLLLEGDAESLPNSIAALGCLPLAERGLQPHRPGMTWIAIGLFAAAILSATLGVLSFPVALALAATLMVALNIVPPRDIYESVDWPVVVLLGAMIPVGQALATSGTTTLIAETLVASFAGLPAAAMLGALVVLTMLISCVINNAATAVVMAPIAAGIAGQLQVSPDAFLMAVAVGASAAFMTPIGHQNNTLIMGPGGYRFGDYWRMGLPLSLVVAAVAVPMLLWIWPL